ncbi:GntR family transcriptional regulator [Bordetella pertussis]|nr:GntR family transcriptional regulator [Bordetella pertussis]
MGAARRAWRERGANALAELALKDGIWLAPGSYFDAADADIPWLRFNVAYSDAAALWRFLRGAGASAQPATRSYSTKS